MDHSCYYGEVGCPVTVDGGPREGNDKLKQQFQCMQTLFEFL